MEGPPGTRRTHRIGAILRITTGALFAAWLASGSLQQVDFQIVWVVVGEASSADAKRTARAGKQLFLASDLMEWSLQNVKVARVEATPIVVELGVGDQFCVSSLELRAYAPDQRPVNGAPLSIAVRQDHKEDLGLRRSRQDICVKPREPGEFPVRFTSLLPAPDNTMRGAQIFVRAKETFAEGSTPRH
jgi:hypothetical protein